MRVVKDLILKAYKEKRIVQIKKDDLIIFISPAFATVSSNLFFNGVRNIELFIDNININKVKKVELKKGKTTEHCDELIIVL